MTVTKTAAARAPSGRARARTAAAKTKNPEPGDLRREALRQSRLRRYAEFFKNRRWRIDRKFELPRGAGQVFQTPFGHKGRAGWVIQEIDADGNDIPAVRRDKGVAYDENDNIVQAAFGWTTLTQAEKMFPGSIAGGAPSRPPRSKPGETPAEEDSGTPAGDGED